MPKIRLLVLLGALALPLSGGLMAQDRGVLQEVWTGVKGSSLDELKEHKKYKNGRPGQVRVLGSFQADTLGDDYGARYSALLEPGATGEYVFWISSDDASELWLSTDGKPEGRILLPLRNPWRSLPERVPAECVGFSRQQALGPEFIRGAARAQMLEPA